MRVVRSFRVAGSVLLSAALAGGGTAAGESPGQRAPLVVPPSPAPPAGDAAPLQELTRDPEALARWLATRNRDVSAAAARIDQAQALRGTAGLRPNLLAGLTLGGLPLGETNPPGHGVGNSLNYGVNVSQQFEIGKRPLRIAAATFRLASERHALTGTLSGSLVDAREAIARVLYLESRQKALQDSLDAAAQILELQRVRYERGDLSGTDLDRLTLDTQVLDADLAQSRADYAESLAACASVLFARCDPGNGDLDALTSIAPPPAALESTQWEATLVDRPDVQALQSLQEAAKQDEALAWKRKVPDPIVSAGFTRDRFVISGNNPRSLDVSVTLPLATSDRGQYDAARARAEGLELQETSTAILARARAEAAGLRSRRETIAATLASLRASALTRADTILQSTADAVAQGELSTTDLLLARRARTDLALKTMDLQYQLFLIDNRLRQVLGLDAALLRSIQGALWPSR